MIGIVQDDHVHRSLVFWSPWCLWQAPHQGVTWKSLSLNTPKDPERPRCPNASIACHCQWPWPLISWRASPPLPHTSTIGLAQLLNGFQCSRRPWPESYTTQTTSLLITVYEPANFPLPFRIIHLIWKAQWHLEQPHMYYVTTNKTTNFSSYLKTST